MSEIKPLSAFPPHSAAVSTSLKTNFFIFFQFYIHKSSLSNLLHKPTSLKLSITSILSSASGYILGEFRATSKHLFLTQHFSHFALHGTPVFINLYTGSFREFHFVRSHWQSFYIKKKSIFGSQ
jgi:hypothetical protein